MKLWRKSWRLWKERCTPCCTMWMSSGIVLKSSPSWIMRRLVGDNCMDSHSAIHWIEISSTFLKTAKICETVILPIQTYVRQCAHGRRFRAFSRTFSSLLSFWRPVYTDQGKIFSMYWISSNICSKLLVFAPVFAWKHKWKRSKTLPCARSLKALIYHKQNINLGYSDQWPTLINDQLNQGWKITIPAG